MSSAQNINSMLYTHFSFKFQPFCLFCVPVCLMSTSFKTGFDNNLSFYWGRRSVVKESRSKARKVWRGRSLHFSLMSFKAVLESRESRHIFKVVNDGVRTLTRPQDEWVPALTHMLDDVFDFDVDANAVTDKICITARKYLHFGLFWDLLLAFLLPNHLFS